MSLKLVYTHLLPFFAAAFTVPFAADAPVFGETERFFVPLLADAAEMAEIGPFLGYVLAVAALGVALGAAVTFFLGWTF